MLCCSRNGKEKNHTYIQFRHKDTEPTHTGLTVAMRSVTMGEEDGGVWNGAKAAQKVKGTTYGLG